MKVVGEEALQELVNIDKDQKSQLIKRLSSPTRNLFYNYLDLFDELIAIYGADKMIEDVDPEDDNLRIRIYYTSITFGTILFIDDIKQILQTMESGIQSQISLGEARSYVLNAINAAEKLTLFEQNDHQLNVAIAHAYSLI